MTAARIRALPRPGPLTELARSEGRRIAAERGVPCLERGTPESREMFDRHGLPCSLESACNPFGEGPTGWYADGGVLVAVGIPRSLTEEDVARILAHREAMAAAKAGTAFPETPERAGGPMAGRFR